MFLDPWTSNRLGASHRTDLARLVGPAPGPLASAAPGLSRRVARLVGDLLVAAGRRLHGPEAPAAAPALRNCAPTH